MLQQFSKFLLKNMQMRHFLSQIQPFLFLCKILQIYKFEGADFKYDNSLFLILALKYPNKAFLIKNTQQGIFSPNLCIFVFSQNLQIYKFEGADFKYDNSFLKFQPKSTQIRHFGSQIQTFSFFHKILQLGKFKCGDFKYDKIVFKFQSKNIQMRHFWSQI